MPNEIDPVSSMLGELKSVTTRTAETVDIIRSDQINARREIDFMKTKIMESAEMVDAMAPTVRDHHEVFLQIKPLLPILEDIDAANKFGKRSVKVVGFLGAAGMLTPLWLWLKEHLR